MGPDDVCVPSTSGAAPEPGGGSGPDGKGRAYLSDESEFRRSETDLSPANWRTELPFRSVVC